MEWGCGGGKGFPKLAPTELECLNGLRSLGDSIDSHGEIAPESVPNFRHRKRSLETPNRLTLLVLGSGLRQDIEVDVRMIE